MLKSRLPRCASDFVCEVILSGLILYFSISTCCGAPFRMNSATEKCCAAYSHNSTCTRRVWIMFNKQLFFEQFTGIVSQAFVDVGNQMYQRIYSHNSCSKDAGHFPGLDANLSVSSSSWSFTYKVYDQCINMHGWLDDTLLCQLHSRMSYLDSRSPASEHLIFKTNQRLPTKVF
jgi:hypothetical protein